MEKIPSTIFIHKHIYRAYNIFATISGPLMDNPLGKWRELIRRGTYQAVSEDSRWAYELVYDLWSDIEPILIPEIMVQLMKE